MHAIARAVVTAVSSFGLIATAVTASPSFASETSQPVGTASAMLAAVTAPLVTREHPVDFSTASNSSTATAAVATAAPAAATPAASSPAPTTDSTADVAEDEPEAPATLREAVEQNIAADVADEEQQCLAASVYYEAKGEPLDGQLAVAQTVLNRTQSGRFPSSICGVVRQPGQFSFVHHGALPSSHRDMTAWRQAVAIARIASQKLWKPVAAGALYFHAKRVSPAWGKARVAALGNHVFYR